MLVYHMSDIEEYNFYLKHKKLYSKQKYIDKDFIPGYTWMVNQMKKHNIIKPKEYTSKFPIWAWYKYNNKLIEELDLHTFDYMYDKGTKYYIFKLNIPDNRILLSDHNFWEQTALTYNFITCMPPKYKIDNNSSDEEIEKWYDTVDYLKQTLNKNQYKTFLYSIWEDMFEINNCDYIQATFWGFWNTDVINIYEIISEYND